jgi:hypothetical protein
MVTISTETESRIQTCGRTIREIQQRGVPFNVPVGVPVVNPFVEKQMRFRAQYKLTGVSLEDVREGVMFGDFRSFMDMKMETFSRKNRTRHFKLNPFTKKMEQVLGRRFGRAGVRTGHAVAAFMVRMLGLVEWEMAEEPVTGADLAGIHVKVTSRFFRGHFKFRIHRQADGVILDDNWLPEGGGDVRTPALPMAWLVLLTHPLGFEQIAERVLDEILRARSAGRPYTGEIGPPIEEIN